MTDHELALKVAAVIAESLRVDDGYARPCVGGVLSHHWVTARSNNAATSLMFLFEQEMKARLIEAARGEVVVGEIDTRRNPGDVIDEGEPR